MHQESKLSYGSNFVGKIQHGTPSEDSSASSAVAAGFSLEGVKYSAICRKAAHCLSQLWVQVISAHSVMNFNLELVVAPALLAQLVRPAAIQCILQSAACCSMHSASIVFYRHIRYVFGFLQLSTPSGKPCLHGTGNGSYGSLNAHFMGGATALLALSARDHLSWVSRGQVSGSIGGSASGRSASDSEGRLALTMWLLSNMSLCCLAQHGPLHVLLSVGHLRICARPKVAKC